MAKKGVTTDLFKLWLAIILVMSVLSLFNVFLSISHVYGGRNTFYMVQLLRFLPIANIVFVLALFSRSKTAFYAVTAITSLIVLLSFNTARTVNAAIYLVLLAGMVYGYKKK